MFIFLVTTNCNIINLYTILKISIKIFIFFIQFKNNIENYFINILYIKVIIILKISS